MDNTVCESVSPTIEASKLILKECMDMFAKKTKDYGTSWRVLRLPSLTDQIYIKAGRIRSIQECKKCMVDESVESDFIAIINYGVTALIQSDLIKNGYSELNMDSEKVIEMYRKKGDELIDLMIKKNHDYGEAWRMMRVESMTDLILMKLLRIKQIEDNDGETIASEGIESGYADIINYSIFCLIRLAENNAGK